MTKKKKKSFIEATVKETIGKPQIIDIPQRDTFLSNEIKTPPVIKKNHWKLLLIPVLILLIFLICLFAYGYWYISAFEQASQIKTSYLIDQVKLGWNKNIFANNQNINILLLGLDEIKNQKEGSKLTDTIMFASLRSDSQIKLLSIPRDLWIDSLKTKINAVYYYGEESENTTGIDLFKVVIEEILNQPVNHVLVVKLDTVRRLIDAVGGIDIDVKKTFTDNKFPREDADPKASDPAVLYETVVFQQGLEHFDGNMALKYIRSRQSEDQEEGTDLARSRRQKQVVAAIASKIISKEIISNPSMIGALYSIWNKELRSTLTESDLVALAKVYLHQSPSIYPIELPVTSDSNLGLITNPPLKKYKQWVYEPVGGNWTMIHQWIKDNL